MKNQKLLSPQAVLKAALSVSLVVSGICLILACVGIYRSGDHPFSREAVAAAFGPIAVPVYISLGLMILSIITALFLPGEGEKRAPEKNEEMLLRRLRSRADLETLDETSGNQVLSLRKSARILCLISLALTGVCAIVFLCYACNPGHFHQSEINGSMVNAMKVLLPCLAIPFGFGVFAAYRRKTIIIREIDLLKQAKTAAPAPTAEKKGISPAAVRYGFLVLAAGLLLYGLFTGGTADVLTKAINICTECVGLG